MSGREEEETAAALPPMAMLRAFDAVGRTGGIRRAAEHLGIDHAAVSRHLRALEAFVGTSLIDRTGGTALTTEGIRYHRAVSTALADIAAETRLLRHRGDGHLTLWCVPGFAFHWLAPRLSRFLDANPEIAVELRPADTPPDFKTGQVDADIRFEPTVLAAPAEVRRIELARPTVFPVCSPAYRKAIGDGVADAAAVLALRLLHEESDHEWRLWSAAQGLVLADGALPGARLWHAHLVLDACRAGRGVALANPFLLGDDLESGRLVRLTPRSGSFAEARLGTYVLSIRRDRWADPSVVCFRTWLDREARDSERAGR